MEKKERKISLTTYVLSLIIMGLIIVIVVMYNNKPKEEQNKNINLASSNTEQIEKVNPNNNSVGENNKDSSATEKQGSTDASENEHLDKNNEKLNTNTEKTDTNTKLPKLEQNEELKNFLSYMGHLNTYKDNNYIQDDINEKDFYLSEKIMIASMFTKLNNDNNGTYYNLEEIKAAIKEIFNEEIDIKKAINNKKVEIEYNSKNGRYYAPAGDDTYSVYIVKIESQTNSNGIYQISFLYGYPYEGDFLDGREGECDCFRTTIKLKVNNSYKFSKYQLVSSELLGKKVGKIKDFIKE